MSRPASDSETVDQTPTPDRASGATQLSQKLGVANSEVERLLDAHSSLLDVVSWLSAHLAALDRAVYPVIRSALPEGSSLVRRHRRLVSEVSGVLRVVERHHSGDVQASTLDPERLTEEVRGWVTRLHELEVEVTDRLSAALDDDAQARLIDDYSSALEHAPTRPHPHLSHAGPFTALVFWLDRTRDKLLDTMDGRHVPVPRVPRRSHQVGRWGSYLLGQPQADGQADPADRTEQPG
jgi:hypothetical protein